MKITKSNYFSKEANKQYLSCSQFKAFQKCEAAALAEIRGEYVRPDTTALLVGGYVDAYFGGTLDSFTCEHPEVFKRDGTLKAEFAHAENIISRIKRDKLAMLLLSGRKQVIRTGTIAGVPFKIKIDVLLSQKRCEEIAKAFPETAHIFEFAEGAIVDQKIMRDFEPMWDESCGAKVSFIRAWGYDLQGAIYQAIEGRLLPFIINAATKETEPDLGAFYIPQTELNAKIQEVETLAPRYAAIKRGEIEATRCEHCDWCRRTKRLHTIVDYRI